MLDIDMAEVERMYNDEGMGLAQIGDVLGVSQCTVRRRMIEHGLKRRRVGPAYKSIMAKASVLREMYEEKRMTVAEVGLAYGVSSPTARRDLEQHGIRIRKQGPFDQAKRDLAKHLYLEEKLTCAEVGDRLGITGQGAMDLLKRSGVPRRSQGTKGRYLRMRASEFVRVCSKGEFTREEAANELGVSKPYMHERLKDIGIEPKFRRPAYPSGPNHYNWKGDDAGYLAKQHRVWKLRGSPRVCESCGLDDPEHRYVWHRQTEDGNDPDDYIRLCQFCLHKHTRAAAVTRT